MVIFTFCKEREILCNLLLFRAYALTYAEPWGLPKAFLINFFLYGRGFRWDVWWSSCSIPFEHMPLRTQSPEDYLRLFESICFSTGGVQMRWDVWWSSCSIPISFFKILYVKIDGIKLDVFKSTTVLLDDPSVKNNDEQSIESRRDVC